MTALTFRIFNFNTDNNKNNVRLKSEVSVCTGPAENYLKLDICICMYIYLDLTFFIVLRQNMQYWKILNAPTGNSSALYYSLYCLISATLASSQPGWLFI